MILKLALPLLTLGIEILPDFYKNVKGSRFTIDKIDKEKEVVVQTAIFPEEWICLKFFDSVQNQRNSNTV